MVLQAEGLGGHVADGAPLLPLLGGLSDAVVKPGQAKICELWRNEKKTKMEFLSDSEVFL